jgi:hypothetical protein
MQLEMKKLFALAVLALFSLSVASAKTYEITLSTPSKAGGAKLKAGRYKLKVEGTNATFTEVNKSTSVTTTVKVQETEKKFEDTRVFSSKEGSEDEERITEIQLGGSNTKLGF